jgi:hypothetical protein
MVKRLQEVSGALLLLRGVMGKDDVSGLMEKLMAGSFLDKGDGDTATPDASQTQLDAQQGADRTAMQDDDRPALSRHPTLESNRLSRRSNTLPAFDPASEKSRILREAFGSNALAHREFRIDLLTAFAELTIFIKLVTVRGDFWFTVGALFLVFGWCAVHTLLLLFHFRELSELEMAAAVRVARTVNAELGEKSESLILFYVLLHLPILGYFSYLAASYMLSWLPLNVTIGMSFLWLSVIGCFYGTCVGIRKTPSIAKLPFLLTFAVTCAWLFASSSSYFFQISPHDSSQSYAFFEPQTPMGYIVDKSFEPLTLIFCLLVVLIFITSIFYVDCIPDAASNTPTTSSQRSSERKKSSLTNALFALVVFALYLIWYDSSKTWKPTWTDVLG